MGDSDDHYREPTQKTRPKRGEPIEIPVPRRDDFEDLVTQATKAPDDEGKEKS